MSHKNTGNDTSLETIAFSTHELSLDTFYEGARKALKLRYSLELRAALTEAKVNAYDYVGYARKNALLAIDNAQKSRENALLANNNAQRAIDDIRLSSEIC